MKKIIFFAAVMIAAVSVNAQTESGSKLKFSIGAEGSMPIGDFGDGYKFGFGGSAQGDYWVSPELALTLYAGYLNYSGKEQTYTTTVGTTTISTTFKNPNTGIVPVMGGIKYKFGTSGVYGSGQLGVAFSTESGGGSNFTYAPGIGYNFSPNFDALLKYQGYSAKGGGSTSSAIGLRLAYTFGGK